MLRENFECGAISLASSFFICKCAPDAHHQYFSRAASQAIAIKRFKICRARPSLNLFTVNGANRKSWYCKRSMSINLAIIFMSAACEIAASSMPRSGKNKLQCISRGIAETVSKWQRAACIVTHQLFTFACRRRRRIGPFTAQKIIGICHEH